MENKKLINKVKNKIAISNLELEEKIMINKRKKAISTIGIVIVCLACSFVTVNAMTENAIVNNIEKTINKLFNKENVTMNYGERNIDTDVDESNLKIDSNQVIGIKHNGVDLRAKYGEDILAVEDGEVIEAKYDAKLGNYIIIKHNNSEFSYTKYAHLSKLNVEVGNVIKKDEKIGEAGQTGMVTGVCLHFEVLDKDMVSIDPERFLN